MIVVFIDGADSPSPPLRALANLLEQQISAVQVQICDLDLRRLDRALDPSRELDGSRELDRVLGFVQEHSPELLGLRLTAANSVAALELCRRAHDLLPGMTICVWGPEASARRAELMTLEHVDRVPCRAVVSELSAIISAGDPGAPAHAAPAHAAPSLRSLGSRIYSGRLRDLIRAARKNSSLMVVQPLGGALPGPLQRYGSPSQERLTVDDAAALLSPLLRAGLTVRLRDPGLCADPAALVALLDRLDDAARLIMEAPAEALLPEVVSRLIARPPALLELDLSSLTTGSLDPAALRRSTRPLVDAGVSVRGGLTFGHPEMECTSLKRAMDICFELGFEDLALRRLRVLPGSPLRAAAGLTVSGPPRYEVMSHDRLSFTEMLSDLRVAACYDLLRDSLAGSGLLRSIALNLGSAADVLEGFGGWLALQELDPLAEELPRPAELMFGDYLDRHHNVDLNRPRGQRLRRPPGLGVRWQRDGRRLVTDADTGRTSILGRYALLLLDRFDQASVTDDVIEQMAHEVAPQERSRLRRDLEATAEKLKALGLLIPDADDSGDDLTGGLAAFTSIDEFDYHYRMLTDVERVEGYRRALADIVAPGMHVIEIGTGTGVLAVLAARAGARVTAIEQYPVIEIARSVIQESGVADQITLIRGRSDLVNLEEPGDVLLSEIVGNRIFNEGLIEMTLDARRRLLRSDAILIPRRIEVWAEVGTLSRFVHLDREFSVVARRYDLALRPVAQWFQDRLRMGRVVTELATDDDDFTAQSDAVLLAALDLGAMGAEAFTGRCVVMPTAAGEANAVSLSFRLELAPGVTLSTRGEHTLHWSKPVYMLPAPVPVTPGRALRLGLSYEAHGELDLSLAPRERRR